MNIWTCILTFLLVVSATSAQYKPQFVCDKTVAVTYLKEDVHIRCSVRADPPIDRSRIYWVKGTPVSLEGNSSDGLYHAYVGKGSSPTEHIMTLKLDRVFKQHFRTYYFEAENQLGKEVQTIELIRDFGNTSSLAVASTSSLGVALGVPVWCTTALAALAVTSLYY